MKNRKKSRIIPAKSASADGHKNRFRFQGFHERVATLKVNPVQKARLEDEKRTESYFAARLAHWRELNLSAPFSQFAKNVSPYCDSLAQILHHEQRIADRLVEELELGNPLCLEALLDLAGQLAHDLGHRFEKHYQRVVQAISKIVSGHQDVEVLEWGFNALAWMFQFLSRLLVPDLRPTFDMLAPLLGKEVKKGHVARSAAEALSFLVRKAALKAERDNSSLKLIVRHIMRDWSDFPRGTVDSEIYSYGLMNLFSDCVKDMKATQDLRPYGVIVYKMLLEESLQSGSLEVCNGVTVNLIHHTNAETFKDIVAAIADQVEACDRNTKNEVIFGLCGILDIIIEVRKGDRIQQWPRTLQAFLHVESLMSQSSNTPDSNSVLTRTAAVLVQLAPFQYLVTKLNVLMDSVMRPASICDFPRFCIFAQELNPQRYQELLHPFFLKYLSHNQAQLDDRLLLVAQLSSKQSITHPTPQRIDHHKWPETLVDEVETWDGNDDKVGQMNAIMTLAREFPVTSAVSERLLVSWSKHIKSCLQLPSRYGPSSGRLVFGAGLTWYLCQCRDLKRAPEFSWIDLTAVCHLYGRVATYVENLSLYMAIAQSDQFGMEFVQPILISNLSTGSRNVRRASLRALRTVHKDNGVALGIIDAALRIEDMPLDHSSVRNISMLVRHITENLVKEVLGSWLGDATLNYLFGLLTFGLTPIWDDALRSLKIIYETGNSRICQLLEDMLFRWLEGTQSIHLEDSTAKASTSESPERINEFQCKNLETLNRLYNQSGSYASKSSIFLRESFNKDHTLILAVPKRSASQALKILKTIPLLAERRSRRLVPLFLAWTVSDEESEATLTGDDSSEDSTAALQNQLARSDKQALLEVFGLLGNPKAIYRSSDVYEALIRLLSSGDGSIQKSSLKAISNWKIAGFKTYEDSLKNLLDNARFREELIMFLPQTMEENGLSHGQRHEMMRILLPILFGRVVAKGKSSSGKMTQTARRKAVFESLGNFPPQDISTFLDVALGPLKLVENKGGHLIITGLSDSSFSLRRQVGFIKLAKDLLDAIGGKLSHEITSLSHALLYCMSRAQINQAHDENIEMDEQLSNNEASMMKVVRQSGMQCFIMMFEFFPPQEMLQQLPLVFSTIIEPRLGADFSAQNSSSVSSMLRLFNTWAKETETARFLLFDEKIIKSLTSCIYQHPEGSPVKTHVKSFIIDEILRSFLSSCQANSPPIEVPEVASSSMLNATASILEHSPPKELLEQTVSLTLALAPSIPEDQSVGFATILTTILSLPKSEIKPPAIEEALGILKTCIGFLKPHEKILLSVWNVLSRQFMDLPAPHRSQLSQTFILAGQALGGLFVKVSTLCADLNALSDGRLDDADLERRGSAFETITQDMHNLTDDQWTPIVCNSLYYIRDEEETFIRKNATHVLRVFIQMNSSLEKTDQAIYPTSKTFRGIVLPTIRRGASERSELIRIECLSVMEHIINTCTEWPEISDMASLNASSEDGESFFTGVTHIQQEMRKRSLIKLARVARQGRLAPANISHFLLPLVEHFVFDRAEETDTHSLAAQAVLTIGALCSGMEWIQVRKTLRRYTGLIKENTALEKALIRLVGIVSEAVYNSSSSGVSNRLSQSIAEMNTLSEDINTKLLPPLLSFLHHKEESVVSLRVPIAVAATHLICLLPTQDLEYRLAPVLTDVCNILRSKAQESRDLSRKTLAEISALIGPSRFSFILKELRIALSRGHQLHVKAYTLHSLLVASNFAPGDLDYCLSEIMSIVLDDLFGKTGMEKDAQDYTNKAKEIKSGKSMDTAERMARIVTISHLKDFTGPIRTLLTEKLESKSVVKMNELLRRLGSGLQQNDSVGTQDTLVFCYQAMNQALSAAKSVPRIDDNNATDESRRQEKYEIKTKSAKKAPSLPQISSQQYKLARFAFDLLRVVFQQHEHLRTPANISGFLIPIGDVLLDAQEEVQIAALRLLSAIVKVPMKQWATNGPVYAQTAFDIIKGQPDTNTELSQAAIKLISAFLRDRPEVVLKATQITELTKAVLPDLTQPSRQGVTFNLLKAIIARKVVFNEIYEAMDATARLFVTYGDGSARNQARSIWLQFVLNYEQSEKRFNQQISFLAQNIAYEHSEGRQSVMEAIHFLIGKLDSQHLQKAATALFLPLVDRVVGDEALTCRDMAALLLKELLAKVDDESIKLFGKILQQFYSQESKPVNQKIAIQIFGIMIEANPIRLKSDIPMLEGWLSSNLIDIDMSNNDDWERTYAALQLAFKLHSVSDDKMLTAAHSQLWSAISSLSGYPHAWVKSSAAKLSTSYISQFEADNVVKSTQDIKKLASGLTLTRDMVSSLVQNYFKSLWRDVPEWLVVNIFQNLSLIEAVAGGWPMVSTGNVDYASNDEDSDLEEDGNTASNSGQTIRDFCFNRLSRLIRRSSSSVVQGACLRLLDILVRRLAVQDVEPSLNAILSALNFMTDPSITRITQTTDAAQKEWQQRVDEAHCISTELQRKLPDGRFVKAMHNVQQIVRRKRDERRTKRRIEAVAEPEKASKDKLKKRERGRERKKALNSLHRSKRRGY